jgi:hypothetical protein
VTTNITELLKAHRDEMNRLHDLIKAERAGFVGERAKAGDDKDLLGGIARRETDLGVAVTLYDEALVAWRASAAARSTSPDTARRQYAECVRLTADIAAIVGYRKDDKPAAKPTSPVTGKDGKDGGDPPAAPAPVVKTDGKDGATPVPAPATTTDSPAEKAEAGDGTDKAAKTKGAAPAPATTAGDESEFDKLMAAIGGVKDTCAKQHEDLTVRLAEIAKGTLPEELATILKGLDPEVARILVATKPEDLRAALSGRGLTDKEAAFLKSLMDMQDDGLLGRFRYTFWGTVDTDGAHR